MVKKTSSFKHGNTRLPLFIEKDEEGFYVVECPVFEGCYTQGKSLDEALLRVREVIALALEEKNQSLLKQYRPQEISLHTITL